MALDKKCSLSSRCKKAGQEQYCNITCYPYVLLHGTSGKGGVWGATNVPEKYRNCFASNLPIKDANPQAYEIIQRYIADIIGMVDRGIGLYLYSKPSDENPFGTGTGKTTSAATILNEYVLARVIQHVKKEREIVENPGLFIKASELQNMYNAQFRGTEEMQKKASERYYARKEQMKTVELLVLDDIAIRNVTDAYENELTEIIDERDSKQRTTIFTSNLSPKEIARILGDRIASRIQGMTEPVIFKGKDYRKRGVL